jgi:NADH-quinone oxidoreductase subunit L
MATSDVPVHPPGPAHATAHGGGGRGHGAGEAHDAPAVMSVPLWILALGAVAVGVGFAVSHPEFEFEIPGWMAPLALTVTGAGIVLSWLTYQRRTIDSEALAQAFGPIYRAALERFWLDDLFAGLYRAVVLGLARLVGWVDRYLVDGVVNLLSAWTLSAGDRLRRIQSGQVQDYVYGVALGLLLLLVWSQWPR